MLQLNILGNFYDEGSLLRLDYFDNSPYQLAASVHFLFLCSAESEVFFVIQKYHDIKAKKDLKIN